MIWIVCAAWLIVFVTATCLTYVGTRKPWPDDLDVPAWVSSGADRHRAQVIPFPSSRRRLSP